jgi:hypothetical protein
MVKLSTLAGCFLAALIGQSTAHFLVAYPPSVGFDEDVEGRAPCGGFDVDFTKDNVTDFHVGGDVLALVRKQPRLEILSPDLAAILPPAGDLALSCYFGQNSFWELDQSHACCSTNWS